MFLRAGILSLALLVASRLLGLLRETTLAAAFGASGLADIAVLMLSLPDWLAGVLASGALAYVMLPAWAGQQPAAIAASQRRLAVILLASGAAVAVLLALARYDALDLLAPGLAPALHEPGVAAVLWSAVGFPLALVAALWVTRLQHERDFTGMYGANLVVNAVLVATLWMLMSASADAPGAVHALGWGLVAAMVLRLLWLHRRLPRPGRSGVAHELALPAVPLWLWAAAAAGLPLALPFAARSIASGAGEGQLATFNYAWKLVELPLMLAIQLVATLALPAVSRAFANDERGAVAVAVRPAFALAWALACAAAAGLVVAAPGLAQLLFGWGRMDPKSLGQVAAWGATGAWGLLPQSLSAVALTVLAARKRMHAAVLAHALALGALLVAAWLGVSSGAQLMVVLNGAFVVVAAIVLGACGRGLAGWLPWPAFVAGLAGVLACALAVARFDALHSSPMPMQLVLAAGAAAIVLALSFVCSTDLRVALRR